MLEVLDPEQNATLPRPLPRRAVRPLAASCSSRTANTLDTIPGPLRDRMEVIQLAGYTEEEKLQIAKRYLVPRQIERNGLKKRWLAITDKALRVIISDYTREAGVRNLEREIGTVCRKVARTVAEGNGKPRRVSVGARPRPRAARPARASTPRPSGARSSRASRRAWRGRRSAATCCSSRRRAMPGKGKLTITGQLGDVMKESAQAALSYVRGHHGEIAPGLGDDWFAEHDLHIHVPAGAIPKDGPSAGITMVTALSSLHQRALRPRRRRDDRRDHADRPGAADRRPEGEGARRAAQRHHDRDRPRAERGRRRGDPRAPAARPDVRVRRVGAARCSTPRSSAADERPRAARRRGQRPRATPKARV